MAKPRVIHIEAPPLLLCVLLTLFIGGRLQYTILHTLESGYSDSNLLSQMTTYVVNRVHCSSYFIHSSKPPRSVNVTGTVAKCILNTRYIKFDK